MTNALKTDYRVERIAVQKTLMDFLGGMYTSIKDRLDWFWKNWSEALHGMTAQLHAGVIDQSRQLAGNHDANDIATSARLHQKIELDAEKLYQPTNQGCQFDTMAKYLSRSRGVSSAVAARYAQDFGKIGNNDKSSLSSTGAAALQKSRWQIYQDKFCDKDNNNGASGCTATPASANMNVLPGRTIFARETIDMTKPDMQEAVNQLLFNITGYEPPDPISPGALKSAAGLRQRQENREYLAQMDAVGALAYSVVAERVPGLPAPEIKAMRLKAGVSVTDASDNPSEREIRQAVIEQLSDPNYYKELYDSPATIPQKELYLKAYGLLMLYDMIAKQEKISGVYAIETANMLDKTDNSRHGAYPSAPLR